MLEIKTVDETPSDEDYVFIFVKENAVVSLRRPITQRGSDTYLAKSVLHFTSQPKLVWRATQRDYRNRWVVSYLGYSYYAAA